MSQWPGHARSMLKKSVVYTIVGFFVFNFFMIVALLYRMLTAEPELKKVNSFGNGKVVEVVEGDTFVLATGKRIWEVAVSGDAGESGGGERFIEQARHVIRFVAVDAPELDQPHGESSRAALADMLLARQAHVDVQYADTEGRLLAEVRVLEAPERRLPSGTVRWEEEYNGELGDYCVKYFDEQGHLVGQNRVARGGLSVSREMVYTGWAWPRRDETGDEAHVQEGEEAKSAGRGLWSGTAVPEPPWEWRWRRQALEWMQADHPDFGGGIRGFLTYGLWNVCRLLPSPGRWDWLFLLLFTVVAQRILLMPFLFKFVQSDIRVLANPERKVGVGVILYSSGEVFICMLWCMYFATPPGAIFLAGRALAGAQTATDLEWGLSWRMLLVVIVLLAVKMVLWAHLWKKADGVYQDHPPVFPNRGLVSLFGGGGAFVDWERPHGPLPAGSGSLICDTSYTLMAFVMFIAIVAGGLPTFGKGCFHVIFAFIVTQPLIDAARMLFVYVLHKRAFGRPQGE